MSLPHTIVRQPTFASSGKAQLVSAALALGAQRMGCFLYRDTDWWVDGRGLRMNCEEKTRLATEWNVKRPQPGFPGLLPNFARI
jgi:hypothetical protein